MLRSLFPRAHQKFLSMPLLGSIVDGFDDWLAKNGYTRGSRKFRSVCCCMWTRISAAAVREVTKLSHTLQECWRDLIKIYPNAGTVRALKRYLGRQR